MFRRLNLKSLNIFLTLLIFSQSIFAEEETLYQNSLKFFKTGDYTQAISNLNELHKLGKESFESRYLAGHAHWKKGDYPSAIEEWQISKKIQPRNLNVTLDLIKAHSFVGQTRTAFLICREALRKFPESRDLKLSYSSLLIKVKRVRQALEIIESLKAENSNDYRSLALESKIYFDMGNFEKAETSIKWALALSPENPNLLNNLALILERLADSKIAENNKDGAKKNLEEAKKQLEIALKKENREVFANNLKRIGDSLNAL